MRQIFARMRLAWRLKIFGRKDCGFESHRPYHGIKALRQRRAFSFTGALRRTRPREGAEPSERGGCRPPCRHRSASSLRRSLPSPFRVEPPVAPCRHLSASNSLSATFPDAMIRQQGPCVRYSRGCGWRAFFLTRTIAARAFLSPASRIRPPWRQKTALRTPGVTF